MCIRDRRWSVLSQPRAARPAGFVELGELCRVHRGQVTGANKVWVCLLYTSDAADERSSVDLGGRRIIKKKKKAHNRATGHDERLSQEDRQNNANHEHRAMAEPI